MQFSVVGLAALLGAGCGGESSTCGVPCSLDSTTIVQDFTGKSGFYGSPFPSDARLGADGRVVLDGFPGAGATDLVKRVVGLVESDTHGFGTTSAIYFQASAPLAAEDLPSVVDSVAPTSPVGLISVDPASPDYLVRYPVSAVFLADGGPYGAPNLLALLPLQGAPLRPKTRYAAYVNRWIHDAQGTPIARSTEMKRLAGGLPPDSFSVATAKEYADAFDSLDKAGLGANGFAGVTVFTTGDPAASFGVVTAAMLAAPRPKIDKPFTLHEVFDDYCVYETTVPMPEYQTGTPPYSETGGAWVFDASGAPVVQRMEDANFVVTIPRAAMPAKGYPVVVMSRTGGGGERPLVDRGVQAMTGGPALVPGTGPALYFAKAGFAGSSLDGPHGGLRNITHGDEQFLMFNVGNPVALRDNVRQSAAELVLQAHLFDDLDLDVSACPGAVTPDSKAHFDTGTMALMGHSMGATIAPLTLAYEPRYRAGLLSGAGGSWIENVIYKQEPIAVKGIAEVLVGVAGSGYELNEHDPVLNLFQWAGEPADPPVYARRIVESPEDGPSRHILMMQGIVDSYILPSIADATSLSLGLDLAGQELDIKNPKLAQFTPLSTLLPLAGRSVIALPAAGNVMVKGGGKVTAVVTQHAEDGIENGHEVVFQTEAPKHEYRCFLEGLLKGAPVVPKPGKALDPCE